MKRLWGGASASGTGDLQPTGRRHEPPAAAVLSVPAGARLAAFVALSALLHLAGLALRHPASHDPARFSDSPPAIALTLRRPPAPTPEQPAAARHPGATAAPRSIPSSTPIAQSATPTPTGGPSKSSSPPASPVIDLEAARRIARESGRTGTGRSGTGLPALAVPKPEAETPLGQAIGKAARPDCRSAYAGADLGLLAIPLLVKDTVTDRGCKW